MKFNKINKIILIGGSYLLSEFAQFAAKQKDLEVVVFSAKRHLDELIYGKKLRNILKKNKIKYFESEDINKDKRLKDEIAPHTLGIAMGATWVFSKKTVNLFKKDYLLDVMNMDLPRYRGGAHHTWRIIHQNNNGCLNLQVINGGEKIFHKGKIVKSEEFIFPPKLIKPIDSINYQLKKELVFLKQFLKKIKVGENFKLVSLKENESSYYPFLYTKINGLINWNWTGKDIYLFISAFDEPYPGASTYLNGKTVFLKDARLLKKQEDYHPFTSGTVVRKNKEGIFIATIGNLLNIKKVLNEKNKNVINSVELGDRLYTPSLELDGAMAFKAEYDSTGLKAKKKI